MRRLLAAALIALPLAAHAWRADGHKTVATIAAGLIKGSPAEARVAELLGDLSLPLMSIWADCAKGVAPDKGYTYPAPGKYPECAPLETPERIAEMADYVRRNDKQCVMGPDEDSCHKQMHYADVPVQRSQYRLGTAGTRPDDVVGALRAAILALQGKPLPGQPNFKSPREALIVLVHLVGDLHQPIHVGSLYLDARGRLLDPDEQGLDPASYTIGGNSFSITPPPATGERNFHSYWDIVPDALRPQQVDAAWLAEAEKVLPDAGDPADWPVHWAGESLQLAGMAMQGLGFSPKQGERWQVAFPAGYEARADAIKRRQLTVAGAHLARLLKTVFPR